MKRALDSHYLLRVSLILAILLSALAPISGLAAAPQQAATCAQATIHYQRAAGDYDGWGLHIWGPNAVDGITWQAPYPPTGQDDFGLFWVVPMQENADLLNYIIHKGDEKDPGPDQAMIFAQVGCEIWQLQGDPTQHTDPESVGAPPSVELTAAPDPTDTTVVVHYRRSKFDYTGWGLHVWGPTTEQGVTWTEPLQPDGQDEYGLYWVVDMEAGADVLNYIVHRGDEKDPGPDQVLDIAGTGREIWLIQGTGTQYADPATAIAALAVLASGDIASKAQAYWLTRLQIAWAGEFDNSMGFRLYYDPFGGLALSSTGIQSGRYIDLEYLGDNLTPDLLQKWPHLVGANLFGIPEEYGSLVPDILQGQYAVIATSADGAVKGATTLQIPGVLDDIYAATAQNEPLGVVINDGVPTLRVWAPTARSVSLHLFADAAADTAPEVLEMTWLRRSGIWEITGTADWLGKYYLYDVEVFIRQNGEYVHNLVTDPYSISLAQNSTRSQIVDFADPALKPAGWDTTEKPALAAPEDIVLYELHIRDFSVFDESVPEEQRGTYLAFTNLESNGMQHLQRLAKAGLTHVHLLPAFDIATINENKSEWAQVDYAALEALPPDSDQQQATINGTRGSDGFNWGYDPFHYTTPEGSYATDPQGAGRILEFRQMVQVLNSIGLRVVMDVVYNHTNAAGQSEKSVLDQVVPGYYHRLDANGTVTNSTCCSNTATEHAMMEKLMIDSLLIWAREYKVDGFRFDLMGHHMVANMLNVRAALDSLTLEADGVDGKSIYVYGEGWNFGEVVDNARGVNATQLNLAGSGIGTFNDRLRDAGRGGSPFGGLQEQGFINGLYTDTNEATGTPESTQLAKLLELTDEVRIGLAGNLAEYQFINSNGVTVSGSGIDYNGAPAGYTADPQENIVYVSAHDNETLFDAIQYKAPLTTSLDDRVRMQNMGLSVVLLSQGIPFIHAGDELLRSKSLDRDSYDSGDWFNRLDFTYQSNNWGAGLPVQDKNGDNWALMAELLGNPDIAPGNPQILAALSHLEEMLMIRKSSPLFRLQTAEEIQQRLRFYNTGPDQLPGLIVMAIADSPERPLDPNWGLVVVFFNASDETLEYSLAELQNGDLSLHPVQQASVDARVKAAAFTAGSNTFSIPARTTAVFVGQGTLADATGITNNRPSTAEEMATEVPAATEPAPAATPEPVEEETPASQPALPWILAGAGVVGVAGAAWWLTRRSKPGK